MSRTLGKMNISFTFLFTVAALVTSLFAQTSPVLFSKSAPTALMNSEKQQLPTEVISAYSETNTLITVELTLKMRDGVYMYASEDHFFRLNTASSNLGEPTISYPQSEEILTFDSKKAQIYKNGQIITIAFPRLSDGWSIEGSLRYQACDSVQCFLPQTVPFTFSQGEEKSAIVTSGESGQSQGALLESLPEFSVKGSEGGFLKSEPFLAFLDNPSAASQSSFAGKSIWVILLLIVVGGVALNLTPCVLPMIPITLAVIGAGSQARSRSRGFLVGGVYGLAMALTYGVLGLVVVLTGTQFGTLNANPIFNFAIAILFVVLALAMFDIIHIDFTKYRSNVKQKENSTGQLIPVFFMGAVAALLAGACVAPVVISVVLYSATLYADGVVAGLFLPFLLGLGMALPWPLAGAGLSIMPKPGNWMIVVRNIFGVFILGTALYYGYSGAKMMISYNQSVKASESKGDVASKIEWNYSLEKALAESKETGKPIVIDFWATWCKNCIVMEKTTFQDDAVAAKMNSYIPVKFQAENPDDPATKEILSHFGIVGLPAYIIIEPKE